MISLQEAIETIVHCLRNGMPKRAQAIAQLAFGIAGDNQEAHLLYGSALIAQGRIAEGLDIFRDVLQWNRLARWHILQAAVAILNARTYLEIGVADGAAILRVAAPNRIGVDPMPTPQPIAAAMRRNPIDYYSMTSNEFFRSAPSVIRSSGIDVAFIDGLHTYGQSLADVENCLAHLNPSGIIFVHDCNPFSEAIAAPAASYDEAVRLDPSGTMGLWMGDVWKTILHLRSCRNDLNVGVLDCDCGIGFIARGRSSASLPYTRQDIQRFSYRDLEMSRVEFLGLLPPRHLLEHLQIVAGNE